MASNKRISLSQLAEYLTASPSRRKSIISEVANPKPFIVQTYNAASAAISSDIVSGKSDGSKIAEALSDLNLKLTSQIQDWQKQHVKLCIETLDRFEAIKPKLNLAGWDVIEPKAGPGSIFIGGLRVVVSPEAILRKQDGNIIKIGGLKFYFSKSKKLSKERALYLGAIIDWYCEMRLASYGEADHKCSMIVDLPGNNIVHAPKAKIRNRNDIEAACEEIADRWPN